MLSSFNVSRANIRATIKDGNTEWVAEVHHGTTNQLMGYARFLIAKGEVELTNFKASLTRKALDFGISDKRNAGGIMAGTHGEGFKVAALVMARKGYQNRYESANFYWRLCFGGRDKSTFYADLSPISASKLQELMAKSNQNLDSIRP